ARENEFIDLIFQKMVAFLDEHLCEIQEGDEKAKDSVSMIIEYIFEHYPDVNLSSQQIGMELNIPYRVVLNEFKAKTGFSVNEYIMSVRMKKAVNLLKNTDYSVKVISSMVGIENDTYFYKAFRKYYGCSPRKYMDSE